MFIKKWQLISVLYIALMDWGIGHLTVIVRTGGGVFANESCPQGRAFNQFLPIPGVSRGRGMLAVGIDSHINHEHGLN